MDLRPYTVKDLNVIIKLLKALRNSNYENLLSANASGKEVSSTDDLAAIGGLVIDVLTNLWENANEDIMAWFADLNQMPLDDFLKSDPSIVFDTIEALATRKESKDFFSNAYQVFKRISNTSLITKSE